MQVVEFETAEQARQADIALYGLCGPGCQRQHCVVFAEPGKLHVHRGAHDRWPVPRDRDGAMQAAGYRVNGSRKIGSGESNLNAPR
jgi:hypothetical protein